MATFEENSIKIGEQAISNGLPLCNGDTEYDGI
jgi:hypothetical protein